MHLDGALALSLGGVISPASDVFGCQIIHAFMASPGVVVSPKLFDFPPKLARQVTNFEQNAAFQRLVPAIELALPH